jgi:hypothetical protein
MEILSTQKGIYSFDIYYIYTYPWVYQGRRLRVSSLREMMQKPYFCLQQEPIPHPRVGQLPN